MRPIQMVDTKTQYHKIKSQVDNAVLEVMESSAFINGKAVQDFASQSFFLPGGKTYYSLRQWNRCIADSHDGPWSATR